jgi:hypothetical protein
MYFLKKNLTKRVFPWNYTKLMVYGAPAGRSVHGTQIGVCGI